MSHYKSEAWRQAKEREITERQSDVGAYVELSFYKDGGNWYADVPEHTQSQNQMVCGADALLERFAEGGNRVSVKMRTVAAPEDGPLGRPAIHLHRIMHDPYGATYVTRDFGWIPRPAWLCNVTETVLGEHPKDIWIYEISHGRV